MCNRMREGELKHGRLSLAATIGYVVPECYQSPGCSPPTYDVQPADAPSRLGAPSEVPAPLAGARSSVSRASSSGCVQ